MGWGTFYELKLKFIRDKNYFKKTFLSAVAYFQVKDQPLVNRDLFTKINCVINPIIFILCLLQLSDS